MGRRRSWQLNKALRFNWQLLNLLITTTGKIDIEHETKGLKQTSHQLEQAERDAGSRRSWLVPGVERMPVNQLDRQVKDWEKGPRNFSSSGPSMN